MFAEGDLTIGPLTITAAAGTAIGLAITGAGVSLGAVGRMFVKYLEQLRADYVRLTDALIAGLKESALANASSASALSELGKALAKGLDTQKEMRIEQETIKKDLQTIRENGNSTSS